MVSNVGLNVGRQPVNFTANNGANVDAGPLKNCLVARDKNIVSTEAGNTYKKTKTNTLVGATIGGLAPLLVNIIKNRGIGGLLTNWKTLAISCPALALAGFAAGSIIDAITNSKKAHKVDAEAKNKLPEDLANVRLGVNTVA